MAELLEDVLNRVRTQIADCLTSNSSNSLAAMKSRIEPQTKLLPFETFRRDLISKVQAFGADLDKLALGLSTEPLLKTSEVAEISKALELSSAAVLATLADLSSMASGR